MADEKQTTNLADRVREAGWERFILDRRAPWDWANALANMGLASSISHKPGDPEWKLNLSKAGQDLRKELVNAG